MVGDAQPRPAVDAVCLGVAGPVVDGGRLYVVTCNLAVDNDNKRIQAVVCVGEK